MTEISMSKLPIVQKAYGLIKWYVPILNWLPRDHKFGLGDRMVAALYDLLEGFVTTMGDRSRVELGAKQLIRPQMNRGLWKQLH